MLYEGEDLLALTPEERAAAGLFLAFQYPVEIPGVGNMYFLRTALNAAAPAARARGARRHRLPRAGQGAHELGRHGPELLTRSVNDGFSGGEKKRNEILQMAMLEPKLAILDETDSGLDIDALRVVASGVNALRARIGRCSSSRTTSGCSTTSCPTASTSWSNGRIVRSGDKELALELEQRGYVGLERGRSRPSRRDGRRSGVVKAAAAPFSKASRAWKPSAMAAQPIWLKGLRQAAFRVGFASMASRRTKDEAWKYTRVGAILEVPFEPAEPGTSLRLSARPLDELAGDVRGHAAGLRQRLLRSGSSPPSDATPGGRQGD